PARTSKPRFRIDAANQLIEDVPPPRDSLELSRLAVARLGKDVIDLLDASAGFNDHEVLHKITWRIAPGERTAILGANGAGKSTLLGLISGQLKPTSGLVKRGKTVQLAMVDQQFRELDEIADLRVRDLLARTRASFNIGGKEFTPAQLLERLGFAKEHLAARVGELSGGQKRRLHLLMVLLSEPNVLVLDEPTNDVDTDMLAAMEDLLDSWPGTLIVVSHDRYLVERVTDQQYAIIDGRLRHLPGGVDEYLRLRAEQANADNPSEPSSGSKPSSGSIEDDSQTLSGAERHAVEKELSAIERRLEKLTMRIDRVHQEMTDHDQSDYEGLQKLSEITSEAGHEVEQLEDRWLELSEQLG
ncbi:MAG: ABC-F family ATP-binding cassette domain-containing protein, partial [Propionibacterium sp.]|nr:ABC-F family ATP-binding cassette domain-containing protein [Propionibacterium sp.]